MVLNDMARQHILVIQNHPTELALYTGGLIMHLLNMETQRVFVPESTCAEFAHCVLLLLDMGFSEVLVEASDPFTDLMALMTEDVGV